MELNFPSKEVIVQKITEEKQNLFALLQRLIQIRSYSGEEEEIVAFILEKMNEFGFDETFSDGLGNAVGRIGNGPLKILYDAHIDTVRVTEGENWRFPPFEGRVVNGKMFGRGVVDEKPAMAGYLIAGKILKDLFKDQAFPFSLYVTGSVLEEDVDGYPLQYLIEKEKIRPDHVLLGEPTDLKVYRGQRGRMELDITTFGKSAHGAHNDQGVNAVYKMTPVIEAIAQLDVRLPAADPLGKGSISVTQVRSQAPSLCSVPDSCLIHLDRRLTVGEDRESVVSEVREILKQKNLEAKVDIPAIKTRSWKGTEVEQEAYFPTWFFEKDHLLVRAGLRTAAAITGVQANSGFWSFSTNGVATAGRFNIPTIGFAPGKEELSHSDKEELLLDDLFKAAQFYTLLPFELCEE